MNFGKKSSNNPESESTSGVGQKKKKHLITGIAIAAVVLIGALIGVIHAERTAKRQALIAEQQMAAELQMEAEQKMRNEYASLCQEYNSAIDLFNENADKYNSFLDALNGNDIPNEFLPLSRMEKWGLDFETYIADDSNLEKMVETIRSINSQASEVKVKLEESAVAAYNSAVDDYNIVASAYNEKVPFTSIDFISDMPSSYPIKDLTAGCPDVGSSDDYEEIVDCINGIIADTDAAIADYLVVEQITNPDEEWVISRLKGVPSIVGVQAVTPQKDPNGLLGKDGGYTACVYFAVKDINVQKVPGNDIVEKGTDAGGAIEVYDTKEHALLRCDYLSQFDNTLLYSGSYAIIGTMVIRTSYQLSNQAQCDLTNQIAEIFTTVDTTN